MATTEDWARGMAEAMNKARDAADPKLNIAHNQGVKSGRAQAAWELCRRLSGCDVSQTEQLIWLWLKEQGQEMEIKDERWWYVGLAT